MIWMISFILFISCNSVEDVSLDIKGVSDFDENEIGNPRIVISRENVLLVKATSNSLVKNQESNAVLQGLVKADFFNEEEIYTTNLKSTVAEIEEERDYLIAIGNVVVLSDSGVTLYTDTLSWDNVKEKVFTDDRVVFITEEKDTLYGIGFESDIELNNWKILKPTGVFHEDEDER